MKGIYLKGREVYLDSVKNEDAKFLMKYFNETAYFLGQVSGKRMTLENEIAFIKESNFDSRRYFFAIRLVSSDKIIGTMSIQNIHLDNFSAETGAMIGLDYVNQGYGTEAKHLLLNWAFNTLPLNKLYSKVYCYNPRSKAYALKNGYSLESIEKEKIVYQGEKWDQWILSIDKKSWEKAYKDYIKKH